MVIVKRGMIDPSKRFILQDLQNECVWFLSADEVQVGFLNIELSEISKKDGSKQVENNLIK